MHFVGLLARSGRSLYHLLGNRRKFERQPASGTIRVTCRTVYVVSTHECLLVDVSPRGIGIQCPEPIPPDMFVQLTSGEGGVTRFARVRYCVRRDATFRVGLELIAGVNEG
jgi:hypothetical protein